MLKYIDPVGHSTKELRNIFAHFRKELNREYSLYFRRKYERNTIKQSIIDWLTSEEGPKSSRSKKT